MKQSALEICQPNLIEAEKLACKRSYVQVCLSAVTIETSVGEHPRYLNTLSKFKRKTPNELKKICMIK